MDTVLFSNLVNMIKTHDNYFDEGVAQYLLKRIGNEKMHAVSVTENKLRNFGLETNIWGLINIVNHVNDLESTLSEYDQQKIQNKKTWASLLSKQDEFLLNTDFYNLKVYSPKQKSINVSFDTVMALYSITGWFKNRTKTRISKEEEVIILNDFLKPEQTYSLHGFDFEKQTGMADFFLEKIIENKKQLIKLQKVDEEDFLSRMFNSQGGKILITKGSPGIVSQLFSDNDIKALIKKASLKDNLRNFPTLLSQMMPMAPPSKWLQIEDKKSVDVLGFFNSIINHATGYSFANIREEISNYNKKISQYQQTNPKKFGTAEKEIFNRMVYLKEELKKVVLTEKECHEWYCAMTNMNDVKVYQLSREVFPLPENNQQSSFFYQKKFIGKFKEAEIEVQKNKLEIELKNKEIFLNKNFKI